MGTVDKVGIKISERIAHLNGKRPATKTINAGNLARFLSTPVGLAVAFSAMNEHYGGNVFWVSEPEWKNEKPRNWDDVRSVIDCHSHYIERNSGVHWGEQYRRGAHGHWWFFPDAYDFRINDGLISGDLRKHEQYHSSSQFDTRMKATYSAFAGRFKFVIMPAPGIDNRMDGSSNDTASQDGMRANASKINGDVKKLASHVAGVVRWKNAELFPSSNPSRIWKTYPQVHWNEDGGKQWLRGTLTKTLAELKKDSKAHTLCIHWWDTEGDPRATPLSEVVSNHPHVNFVIFHSCYPEHEGLTELIQHNSSNLFAEIGGTFANHILGFHGIDDVINGVRPSKFKPGPIGAIEMLRALRNSGKSDMNIVWGTDAIWHGSPRWQIEAFKRLKLSTDADADARFKRRVLSANAKRAFSAFSTSK